MTRHRRPCGASSRCSPPQQGSNGTRPVQSARRPRQAAAWRTPVEETTEVHVSIGRIEVTAVHEAAPTPKRAPARSQARPEPRGISRAAKGRPLMSSALAIAGVTAVPCAICSTTGSSTTTSAACSAARSASPSLPPDRVVAGQRHRGIADQSVPAPGHAQPRLAQRGPAVARRLGAPAPHQCAARAQPALPALRL